MLRSKRHMALLLVMIFAISIFTPLSNSVMAASPEKILYVFDLDAFIKTLPTTKIQYDYLKFATTIQGLVNRDQSQIYYLFKDNDIAQSKNMKMDTYWLDKLKQNGKYLNDFTISNSIPPTIEGFYTLIDTFQSYFDGFVLWDEDVPATANVASTISGVESLLPVRFDDGPTSLYADLFAGQTPKYQLSTIKKNLVNKFTGTGTIPDSATPSSGSSKNDAYLWAKEQYLDKGLTSKELMTFSLDGFSWKLPEGQGKGVEFISSYLPSTMKPGETVDVEITIRNNGVETLSFSTLDRLGSLGGSNPATDFIFSNHQFGGEPTRVYLESGADLEYDGTHTFKFSITAPATEGSYNMRLQMVRDGISWFGQIIEKNIMVKNVSNEMQSGDYSYVKSIEYPRVMAPNDKATIKVKIKNIGDTTWNNSYTLCADIENNVVWDSQPSSVDNFLPNDEQELTFTVTAPAISGLFKLKGQMKNSSNQVVRGLFSEDIIIISDNSSTTVPISNSEYSGIIYSVNSPVKVPVNYSGNDAYVEVKAVNTGTKIWSGYNGDFDTGNPTNTFGIEGVAPNSISWANPGWAGYARCWIPKEDTVAPGQSYTFRVKLAPTASVGSVCVAGSMTHHSIASNWTNAFTSSTFDITSDIVSSIAMQGGVAPTWLKTYPNPNELPSTTEFEDLREDKIYYPDLFNTALANADYYIAKKAFFFDLSPDEFSSPIDDRTQPIGTDTKTMKTLLRAQAELAGNSIYTVSGFITWSLKYTKAVDSQATMDPVPAEWKLIDIISTYHGELDADALNMVGLSNASVFTRVPLNSTLKQKNDKGNSSLLEYDKDTEYIMFYMGDYDAGAWASGVMPVFWDDPARGELPLAWPLCTGLSRRVPQVYNYIYDTATTNDYFVTGDNGTGYLNPMFLEGKNVPNGMTDFLDVWKNHNIAYNQKFDLDITGFLIGGNAPMISETVQKAYSEMTPYGVIHLGGVKNQFYNETPFINYTDIGMGGLESAVGIINAKMDTRKQFHSFRSVLSSPTAIVNVVNRLRTEYPQTKFEVVDPYTFTRLFKEAGGEKAAVADVTYESQKASAITIDGVATASEWDDVQKMIVSPSSEVAKQYGYTWGGFSGDSDLSSTFKIKWDKTNLYILEERIDNVVNLTAKGDKPSYVTDCSMVYLDLNGLKDGISYFSGDYGIYIAPSSQTGTPLVFLREGRDDGLIEKNFTDKVTIASNITSSGYTYELSIPWLELQAIDYTPMVNSKIGMTVLAIDNDTTSNSGAFKGQIMWVGNGDDQSNWADMKFVGELEVVTTVELSVNTASIEVPATGDSTITTATAISIVKDQFGSVMTGQTVDYSIPETAGVTINPVTGVITIGSLASAGTLAVTATCGNKVGTAELTLTKATIPTPTPTTTPTPVPGPVNGTIEVKPELKNYSAISEVSKDFIDQAYKQVKENADGIKTIIVDVNKIESAKDYIVQLPASNLTTKKDEDLIKINTPIGSVTVPGNMFKDKDYKKAEKIGISIGIADVSDLDQKVKEKIGDRPIIELNAIVDGKVIEWKNNQAPVTVSIDYKPTEEELKNPEHIVVWYIDGKGKANALKNGRYDAAIGKVTFTVSHFSKYAIAYNKKTFSDISSYPWAKKEIEVMASRGIVSGITEDLYNPTAKISRGEFIENLINSLELTAEFKENFNDITLDENYYEEVGIAKALGITAGTGNNKFNPKSSISRQEMMVLTTKAMKAAGIKFSKANIEDIKKYKDFNKIAGYAKESVASLVQLGIIKGNGNSLNPLGSLTRAEAAVVIYKIYTK